MDPALSELIRQPNMPKSYEEPGIYDSHGARLPRPYKFEIDLNATFSPNMLNVLLQHRAHCEGLRVQRHRDRIRLVGEVIDEFISGDMKLCSSGFKATGGLSGVNPWSQQDGSVRRRIGIDDFPMTP